MERKIGETFEYKGKIFKVAEAKGDICIGCFFNGRCFSSDVAGDCESEFRSDKKDVIFVEIQEQPQKTEEIKERKVGEVFEYEGHKLKVVTDTDGRKCPKCFFYSQDCSLIRDVTGYCLKEKRIDRKSVTFMEVKDEQPQEQAEQPQLNLCEILKYCPIGTKFWSPLLGEVELSSIHGSSVSVRYYTGSIWDINSDGTTTLGGVTSPEIILFPSREQRDWTKVKYEPKKEKFDPKMLKAFDKVIVKNIQNNIWHIQYFSHINEKSTTYPFFCLHDSYAYCIPYNDDTKHLVGTKEEAPDFYKYWGIDYVCVFSAENISRTRRGRHNRND